MLLAPHLSLVDGVRVEVTGTGDGGSDLRRQMTGLLQPANPKERNAITPRLLQLKTLVSE